MGRAEIDIVEGSPQKLQVQLSTVSITPLSTSSSKVGPLNCCFVHVLGDLAQFVIKYAVQKAHKHLSIDLPTMLLNTRLHTSENAFRIYTDVHLDPSPRLRRLREQRRAVA